MDDPVKKAWVDALRSGEYKQTREVLASNQGMCCLGVLLHINGMLKPGNFSAELGGYSDKNCQVDNFDGGIFFPSGEALRRLGLADGTARRLADMNDDGDSFERIAEVIEEMVY